MSVSGHCAARRVLRGLALLLPCVVGLAGCSSDSLDPVVEATSDPAGKDSGGSSSHTSCELLTEAELTELSGEPLSEPVLGSTAGLPVCQWRSPDGVGIQLVSVPAATWAKQVPAILEQIQASDLLHKDPEFGRKMEDVRRLLKSGAARDPDGACALFGGLLEIQGQPAGESSVINLIPTKDDPQAISGQSCSQGMYTSVLLAAPDLGGLQR